MEYQAIILAAGNSTRSALKYNKVLYQINNQPILYLSSQKFLDDKDCKELIVVCKECEIKNISEIFFNIDKVRFVVGGETRQQSVNNALKFVNSEYVLIHDGARPYFTNDLLIRIKDKLCLYNCVIPAISMTDTVKIIKDNLVIKTLNREEIKRVQTPQGFKSSLIKKAHDLARHNNYSDDSSMLEELLNEKILVIDGEISNKKYTNKEDF